MPAFEVMDRHDPAVLWLVTGVDRYNEPIRGNPCQIMVNWMPSQRVVRQSDGTTLQVDGTAQVDRNIPVGSIMWMGALLEFKEAEVPATNPLLRVVGYNEDGDLKGRFTIRKVTLAKMHRTLPQKG